MIRLTVSIGKNARLVRQGLQNLRTEIPKIGRQRIYEAWQRVVRKMQVYPAPRAGQKYMRTFRLRAGWRITAMPDSPASGGYQLSNVTPYAKYPVGNAYGEGQAWMHRGRWQTLRDVVDVEVDKLPKTIQENIVMVARRSFGA